MPQELECNPNLVYNLQIDRCVHTDQLPCTRHFQAMASSARFTLSSEFSASTDTFPLNFNLFTQTSNFVTMPLTENGLLTESLIPAECPEVLPTETSTSYDISLSSNLMYSNSFSNFYFSSIPNPYLHISTFQENIPLNTHISISSSSSDLNMALSDTNYFMIAENTALISTERETVYTSSPRANIQPSPSTSVISNP